MSTATWPMASPAQKYALPHPQAQLAAVDSQLPAVAGPSVAAETASSPLHPDSPLFWFGVIALVSFGLMAASTSVRVGKATTTLAVGKA